MCDVNLAVHAPGSASDPSLVGDPAALRLITARVGLVEKAEDWVREGDTRYSMEAGRR